MQGQENIQFDIMPDFQGMFLKPETMDSSFEETEYKTLYDELLDKCNPIRFNGGGQFNRSLYDKANHLYDKILRCKDKHESALIPLRDEAIDTLGVNISTKKKYQYLDDFLNPDIYSELKPYDVDRVSEAAKWYEKLCDNRSDIRALEALESEASDFIDRRKKELTETAEREEVEGNPKGPDGGDDGHNALDEFMVTFGIVMIIVVLLILFLGINLGK